MNSALEFDVKQITEDDIEIDRLPYLKIKKQIATQLTGILAVDPEKIGYSAFEIDDLLLGYFDDLGRYVREKLIDFGTARQIFEYYVEESFENPDIDKYLKDKENEGKYNDFRYIYKRFRQKRAMTTSKLIAGLLGPTLIANGAALLLNLTTWRTLGEQFARDPELIYVVGIVVLVAGLAIVRSHNVWTGGWPVVVTIFGWLAILGGLARMLFPVQLAEVAVGVLQAPGVLPTAAIAQLLLGAFFSLKAYRGG
jgi:hypothetical protein